MVVYIFIYFNTTKRLDRVSRSGGVRFFERGALIHNQVLFCDDIFSDK